MNAAHRVLASTAILVCTTGTAMAQETSSAGVGLEDIVVTARRVEENLQRVPVVVTTLNAGAIERRNITAVNDIQFSVPNLQIRPSTINPSRPEIVIRGQRQINQTDENVVTYVNAAEHTRADPL